jgi:hypothetical protein
MSRLAIRGVWLLALPLCASTGCAASSPRWRDLVVERTEAIEHVGVPSYQVSPTASFVAWWSDPDAPSHAVTWLEEDVLMAVPGALVRFDVRGRVVATHRQARAPTHVLGVGDRAFAFEEDGVRVLDAALRTLEVLSLEGLSITEARFDGGVVLLGRRNGNLRLRGSPIPLVALDADSRHVWISCDDALRTCRGLAFADGQVGWGERHAWHVRAGSDASVVSRLSLEGRRDSARVRGRVDEIVLHDGHVELFAGGCVTRLGQALDWQRELDFGDARVHALGAKWLVERDDTLEVWSQTPRGLVRESSSRDELATVLPTHHGWCSRGGRCEGPTQTVHLPGMPTFAVLGARGRALVGTRRGAFLLPEGVRVSRPGAVVFVRGHAFAVSTDPVRVTPIDVSVD